MRFSLKDAIMEYKQYLIVEKALSQKTIDRYMRILNQYDAFLSEEKQIDDPINIIYQDISDFIMFKHLQGLKEKSIAQLVSAIKGFHEFTTLEKITKINVASLVESPKPNKHLPRILSVEEMILFLDSIEVTTATQARNKLMVELLYATGMRVSELCNLKLNQLHLSQGFIRCIGKGNKERLIPIAKYMVDMLQHYIDHDRMILLDKQRSQYLFINNKGKVISRNNFYAILNKLVQNSPITKKIHPHLIRHTFATHLLENGADLRSIQELLGHRNIETTTIYTHISTQKLNEEYIKFHPRGTKRERKK